MGINKLLSLDFFSIAGLEFKAFRHNDYLINNPYYNETGKIKVNPKKYYKKWYSKLSKLRKKEVDSKKDTDLGFLGSSNGLEIY